MTEAEIERQATAFLRGVVASLSEDTPFAVRQALHDMAGIAPPPKKTANRERRSMASPGAMRSAPKPTHVFEMHRGPDGLLTHVTASRVSS